MATEPASTEPKEPTTAESMAMAQAAMKAAEEAKTAAEARPAVKAAVEEEAEAQGLNISEEEAQMIANTMITALESRGAFSGSQAQPEGEAPPVVPEGEAGAEGGTGGVAPPAGEHVEPPTVAPGEEPEEAPRRKSLAERFQGR